MLPMAWEFLRMLWQQKLWEWFPERERRSTFYSIQELREQHPDWFRADLAGLFEMALEQNIDPQIWKRMPLAEAAEAHRHIESGDVRGKIVLVVAED